MELITQFWFQEIIYVTLNMAFQYFKILIFVQAFVYAVSFERIWQQKFNYSASQKPFYPCHDCIYMLFKLQKKSSTI